jgi:VanZ family protein
LTNGFITKKKEERTVAFWPIWPKFTQSDKQMHALVGFALADVLLRLSIPWVITLLIVAVIATLKEIKDYFVAGNCCETADAVATVIGAAIVVAFAHFTHT